MDVPPSQQEPIDPLRSKWLWLVVGSCFAFFLLSVWLPIQDVLTHLLMLLGGDTFLQRTTVPYELRFVSTLLTFFGFHIQAGRAYLTWQQALGKNEFIYFTWNCGGWQSFLLFLASALPGLRGAYTRFSKWQTFFLGLLATYLFTLFRLMAVLVIYIWFGRPLGILFHDYLTIFLTFGYLVLFWWFVRRFVLFSQTPSYLSQITGKSAIALLLTIALLSNSLVFFSHVPVAHATAQPTIEQQVNILDQTITGSTTLTNGATGMVLLDAANYTGATYYFEVVAKVTSGQTGTATLTYNAGTGATVSGGSTIQIGSITATSYTRYRSSSFSPTGAQNAYISALSASGTGISILAARIIIVQTDPTSINNSITQIELGDAESTTATSYTPLASPKFWTYDATKYDGTLTVSLEATLKNATSGQTASAALYTSGSSCSSQVASSVVTTGTGANVERDRATITQAQLSNGTTYMVCFKASGNTATLMNAKLIIQQTTTTGLTKTEIQALSINTFATTAATAPAFDTSNTFTSGTSTTSYTFSYTIGSQSNRALFVAINPGNSTVKSMTYNSTSLTKVNTVTFNGSSDWELWYLLVPSGTTGAAHNLVITMNATSSGGVGVGVASYYNVSSIGTQNTATGASTTPSVTVNSNASQLVIDAEVNTNVNATVNAGQTMRWQNTNWGQLDGSDKQGGSGTTTMSWTTAGSQNWADIAVPLNGISSGSYVSQNYLFQYNPANWAAGTFTYYFGGVISTNNGSDSAYAQLYDVTSASAISGSAISTTNTAYTLVNSGSVTSMPSTADDMDTQINNTSSGTGYTVASWLMIDVSSLQTPEHVLPLLPLAFFIPLILSTIDRRRKSR